MKPKLDLAKIQRALSKYKYVALVLCLGMLLMLLPTAAKSSGATETEETEHVEPSGDFNLEELEEKLSDALSQISGVGEATVVLTLRSSGEEVLAQDTSEGNSTDTETVIISTGSNTEQAVSIKTIYPEFQGALVICDGAGSASVKWEVLQAVSAITGLSSDQISICQRK